MNAICTESSASMRDPVKPVRLWIEADADAACGTGKRRDPDDCLALLSLASARHVDIAGISTVFGNAPVSETDAVMRPLVDELMHELAHELVHELAHEFGSHASRPGSDLWPPAVLVAKPTLATRVTRAIAVMGRRPGHRFHPIENRATGAMLFGHGPIFRDLNAALDAQAAAVVLASGVPVLPVPYTATRQLSVTGSDLDWVALASVAGRWVAGRRSLRITSCAAPSPAGPAGSASRRAVP